MDGWLGFYSILSKQVADQYRNHINPTSVLYHVKSKLQSE